MKAEKPAASSGREDAKLMTAVDSDLPAPRLDRERVRARVAEHLAAKRPVEELGIERNRPADTRDFAFVGRTPTRKYQPDYYRCSFCQTDRKFGTGRIVLSSDGLLRLIGDKCWKDHLDEGREAEERKDYDAYKRKMAFEKTRERVGPEAAAVAAQIQKARLEHEAVLQFIEGLPRVLRKGAPVLYERLQASARLGGQLQVQRTVQDYARGGFILQFETVHRVSGLSAVLAQPPCLGSEEQRNGKPM